MSNEHPTHVGYDTVFRPGLFQGRVALVTGGGTGIGRAIAHELAALGATVVIAARREEPLVQVVGEIAAVGGTADHVCANIREPEQVRAMVGLVVQRHGRIDLLVNNAGGQFPSPAADISTNGWRTVVDLNLNGTFEVTREVFNQSMAQHGGAIVSIVAEMWNGFPGMAHTGAARAGVVNMTKTLAVEWGSDGVRVNAVAPGVIYSSGMDTYDPAILEAVSREAGKVPAGRVGTESETAASVVFLLSEAAAYITGATLRVDGGSSLARSSGMGMAAHSAIKAYDGFHLAREIPDRWRGETG